MDTDWITSPIFIIYLIAFLLMWAKPSACILHIRIYHIIILLIFLGSAAIGLSLYHDSSTLLGLHF